MDTLLADLRFAARTLLKAPGFTLVTCLTLGLGIGANTAIFSVVNAVLLRPLPFPESDRLAVVWTTQPKRWGSSGPNSHPDFEDYRDQNRSFEALAALRSKGYTLTGDARPERLVGARASAELFPILRTTAELGRVFTTEEDRPAGQRVAVLSHGLWTRRFAANPAIVGQSITLDRESYTVVGVLPAAFHLPFEIDEAQVFTPLGLEDKDSLTGRGLHYLRILGRLRAGVRLADAGADLQAVSARLAKAYPDTNVGRLAAVFPLREEIVGKVRGMLLVLLGAVALVLLVSCSNVANLLLARATQRERELAVRGALGASRGRLTRQLLTESVVLALLGGALGLLVAFWGVALFRSTAPAALPRLDEVRVDARVLGFTLLVSAFTGLLFGTAPALGASRVDPLRALGEGGRGSAGPRAMGVRSLLVVGEVALSLVLLASAGLLLRSLERIVRVNPGFEPEHVLTLRLALPDAQYTKPEQSAAFYRELISRVAALPGVQGVAAVQPLPFSGDQWATRFRIASRPEPAPGEALNAEYKAVTPDYFRTMGIGLRAGRLFGDGDARGKPGVLLVTETLARRYFPGGDALGQRVRIGVSLDNDDENALYEIVGVVADAAHERLDAQARPGFYVSAWQQPWNFLSLVVRSERDATQLAGAIRGELKRLDPDVPAYRVESLTTLLAASFSERRFHTLLLAGFSGLGLLLAALGLYGVMTFSVGLRTREIAIRTALGAERSLLVAAVLRQALTLVGAGVGLGLLGALALGRTLRTLLFGIGPADPLTFASVAFVLGLTALVAAYLPARRAARVDPMVSLRGE